jgi:hypothetical protein
VHKHAFFLYPDKDYTFHLVALPGPGVVVGRGFDVPYLPKPLAPTDAKAYPSLKNAPILDGGLGMYADLFHSYRVIDSADTRKVLTIDIELDPGRTLKGKLVGPDGKPVAGALAIGLTHDPVNVNNWSYRNDLAYRTRLESQTLPTAEFAVLGLDPKKSRTLTFLHKERKLIAHLGVEGNAKGPLTVRLEPWGVLKGRLVDARGQPLRDVRLRLDYPEEEFTTDRQGQFRVEGVVPGRKHELTLASSPKPGFTGSVGNKLQGLTTRSGEVRDLGDVRVTVTPVGKAK